MYREHPDPGLHGAIDWLLRQKWGKGKELAAIDAELARAARARGGGSGGAWARCRWVVFRCQWVRCCPLRRLRAVRTGT